jgi:hypothetical protein
MDAYSITALALQTPGFEGRTGLPVLLIGPPGGGKSSKIRAIGRSLQLPVETLIASIHDPTDFSGLGFVSDGELKMHILPAFQRLITAGQGIFFLDELSNAPRSVQAALLRVLLEGYVGDVELPPGVRPVLAMNGQDTAADGQMLVQPLIGRVIQIPAPDPTPAGHADYLLSASAKSRMPDPEVPVLNLARFDECFRDVAALYSAYIARREGALRDEPKDEVLAQQPHRTPRSWELGLRGFAAGRAIGSDYASNVLLAGAIGDGAAAEFCRWVKENDLEDPREILANPKAWVPNTKKLDRLHATLFALAQEAGTGTVPAGLKHAEYADRAYMCFLKLRGDDAFDVGVPAILRLNRLLGDKGVLMLSMPNRIACNAVLEPFTATQTAGRA